MHIEGQTPWETLEGQIRQTTLLEPRDGEMIYPYEDAEISLIEIDYADVWPTTKYVLRENLATQASLLCELANHGYKSQLDLEGSLHLITQYGDRHSLTPPIVETTPEDCTYILDGAHRTTIGRWLGRTSFMGIHIVGIRPDCPSYARPNPWEDIKIYDTLPEDKYLRKLYRQDARKLYRDFGPINGSAFRKK